MSGFKRFFGYLALLGLVVSGFAGVQAEDFPPLVLKTGSKVLEVPTGGIGLLDLTLKNASLATLRADGLRLTLKQVVFKTGSTEQLSLDLTNALVEGLLVEQASLISQPIAFNAFEFLNNKRLLFLQPVAASFNAHLTQESLSTFLATPQVQAALEKALSKQTGGLVGLSLTNPVVRFTGKTRFTLDATVGVRDKFLTGATLSSPVKLEGNVGLLNGKPSIQNLQLISNAQPIPVDLAAILGSQLNQALNPDRLLQKQGIILTLTKLEASGNRLSLQGQALLTKLELNP